MDSKLKDAFRWHRQKQPGWKATRALEAARQDVREGKARYPDSTFGTSALGAPMEDGSQWCERPDAIGLRKVGTAYDIARAEHSRAIDHTGWYVDSQQDETASGVVFQLPARNRKPVFVAGMADPYGNGDSCAIDLRRLHDDKLEAARAADQMAERYAEHSREYDEAWRAASDYAETIETVKDAREHIMRVVDAWRANPVCRTKPEGRTMRELVADKVCALLRERSKAFAKRAELASDNSWRKDWQSLLKEHGVVNAQS